MCENVFEMKLLYWGTFRSDRSAKRCCHYSEEIESDVYSPRWSKNCKVGR